MTSSPPGTNSIVFVSSAIGGSKLLHSLERCQYPVKSTTLLDILVYALLCLPRCIDCLGIGP